MSCSAPISWLALERYRLGEVVATDRGGLEAHLEGCGECRAALAHIDADRRRLPLLPLPMPAVRRPRASRWWPALALSLGAAAVLLVAVPRGGERTKGEATALALVRERAGAVTRDAEDFAQGDRWKALATCAPGTARFWRLRAEQDGAWSFPLQGGPIRCANEVALPGAFALSGKSLVRVCLLLGEEPPADDAEPTACATVAPSPR